MAERRRAKAGLGPAHRAVGRNTRPFHCGDDFGAVGALRGDAAIGQALVEFGRAIGNELGGHGVEHRAYPIFMPALIAGPARLGIKVRREVGVAVPDRDGPSG